MHSLRTWKIANLKVASRTQFVTESVRWMIPLKIAHTIKHLHILHWLIMFQTSCLHTLIIIKVNWPFFFSKIRCTLSVDLFFFEKKKLYHLHYLWIRLMNQQVKIPQHLTLRQHSTLYDVRFWNLAIFFLLFLF